MRVRAYFDWRWVFLFLLISTSPLMAFGPSKGKKSSSHQRPPLVSIHIVDRNGLSETISQSDRLKQYRHVNFLQPQPYQKVLRVFERNQKGEIGSLLTSYHENGTIKQYLEVVNGRAHGSYQEWHPNGIVALRTRVVEGIADLTPAAENSWIFDGTSYAWDEEGLLLAEIPYAKGELESNATYYHSNGLVWKKIPYTKNEINGDQEIFLDTGTLLEKTPYNKGVKDGTALRYWPNQSLASKEEYTDGRLWNGIYIDQHGKEVSSIENGWGKKTLFGKNNIAEQQEFQEGIQEGEVTLFNHQQEMIATYFVKHEVKHGEEIAYYPSPNPFQHLPRLSIQWYEGKIHGVTKTWYEDGTLESQREMTNNQKNGLLTAWYRDGSLMMLEEYEKDVLKKGEYFRKGEKRACSTIIEGSGIATLFDNRGNFLRKVLYENGKPDEA